MNVAQEKIWIIWIDIESVDEAVFKQYCQLIRRQYYHLNEHLAYLYTFDYIRLEATIIMASLWVKHTEPRQIIVGTLQPRWTRSQQNDKHGFLQQQALCKLKLHIFPCVLHNYATKKFAVHTKVWKISFKDWWQLESIPHAELGRYRFSAFG